jgi:hypothetical protein
MGNGFLGLRALLRFGVQAGLNLNVLLVNPALDALK